MSAFELEPEARERASQRVRVAWFRDRDTSWLGVDLDDGAPVVSITMSVNVPFGIARPRSRHDARVLEVRCTPGRQRGVPRDPKSARRRMRRSIGTGLAASRPMGVAEQLLEEPPDRAGPADRARQELQRGCGVLLAVVELAQGRHRVRAGFLSGEGLVTVFGRRDHLSRAERAERIGRGRQRFATRGDCQRGLGRVGPRRQGRVDQPADRGREARRLLRQRAVTFDREIPLREGRAPPDAPHHLRIEAAGREERGLHCETLQLQVRGGGRVHVHRRPVGPRRVARFGGGDLDKPSRDRRRDQSEPFEPRGCRRVHHALDKGPCCERLVQTYGRARGPVNGIAYLT